MLRETKVGLFRLWPFKDVEIGNSRFRSRAPLLPGYGPLRFLRLIVGSFLAGQNLLGNQAGVLPDRCLDAGCDVGIVAQERFCVLAALADALAVMGEP